MQLDDKPVEAIDKIGVRHEQVEEISIIVKGLKRSVELLKKHNLT